MLSCELSQFIESLRKIENEQAVLQKFSTESYSQVPALQNAVLNSEALRDDLHAYQTTQITTHEYPSFQSQSGPSSAVLASARGLALDAMAHCYQRWDRMIDSEDQSWAKSRVRASGFAQDGMLDMGLFGNAQNLTKRFRIRCAAVVSGLYNQATFVIDARVKGTAAIDGKTSSLYMLFKHEGGHSTFKSHVFCTGSTGHI